MGLSGDTFSGMWSKAASLVADDKVITDAPGLPKCKMAKSLRNPHLISVMAKGKLIVIALATARNNCVQIR